MSGVGLFAVSMTAVVFEYMYVRRLTCEGSLRKRAALLTSMVVLFPVHSHLQFMLA